jgi:hypothetical protein
MSNNAAPKSARSDRESVWIMTRILPTGIRLPRFALPSP